MKWYFDDKNNYWWSGESITIFNRNFFDVHFKIDLKYCQAFITILYNDYDNGQNPIHIKTLELKPANEFTEEEIKTIQLELETEWHILLDKELTSVNQH